MYISDIADAQMELYNGGLKAYKDILEAMRPVRNIVYDCLSSVPLFYNTSRENGDSWDLVSKLNNS